MGARAAKNNDGMGSLPYSDGSCRFRVWAPFAKGVQVVVERPRGAATFPLASEGNGNWSADVPAVPALARYHYLIENVGGDLNDNSRIWRRADARALQVEDSGELSESYVIAPFTQERRPAFTTPRFENFIAYQLHVGSFAGLNDLRARPIQSRSATFLDVVDKLSYIRGLGFNALALLPIGDVHDDLNGVGEGYGTCDMFAPEDGYATSKEKAVAELLALVDRAHAQGIAVFVDVVYNHSALKDNRYWRYDGSFVGACKGGDGRGGGVYFDGGHETMFGCGFAMWKREVKDFFLDNARMFVRDYRVDGIRFDAVQFIQPDALQYITGPLRRDFADKYLIAEYNPGDPQSAAGPLDPFGTLGFSATWDLASPGRAYDALSGSNPVDDILALVGDFRNPNPWCSVRYLAGSHDQIYDGDGTHIDKRYLVERLGGRGNGLARAKARLAWALNVALPGTPMLFMGTEGHLDGYWDPDGDHGEHRVDWQKMGDPIGAPMQQLVRDMNNLRWQHPALRSATGDVVHGDRQGRVVAFKRYTMDGDIVLAVVNASDNRWVHQDYGIEMGGESGLWREIFNSQAPVYGGLDSMGNFGAALGVSLGRLFINLPSWCVLMFTRM
jgi:1,4-alpha-glucan branching enzyme